MRIRDREREKRLAIERWTHRISRKGKLYDPDGIEMASGGSHDGFKYRSRILDGFFPFTPFGKRKHRSEGYFAVPKHFSLSDNTSETLKFYYDVVAFARTAKIPRLLLDHRDVQIMGLAADSILGVLLTEITHECRSQRGSSIRGWKAKKRSVRKMMDEIGCVRALDEDKRYRQRPRRRGRADKILTATDLSFELAPNQNVYKYQNSKSMQQSGLILDISSTIGKRFSDHLDRCLNHVGKKLTGSGRSDLLEYVCEVVANAHEHSGNANWLIAGYIDVEEAEPIYRCIIVSFGKTMAKTFQELTPTSYANREINAYLKLHTKRGLFSQGWREEDLITVMALQEKVSSRNQDAESTRGQGTVDFIKFFQKVTSECVGATAVHHMALVSGSTRIMFDGSFSMKEEGPNKRKIIAFNNSNDLSLKPDARAVKVIDGRFFFPGVAISISAPLVRAMVENTNERTD